MAIYRLRVWFEDQEDIYREIDLQTRQTFLNFHQAIQQAIGFDASKEASFFISDDYWRKGREIALHPKPDDDDDDDDFRRPKKVKPVSMQDARLAEFIDDPHQKILYFFDPQAGWVFHIQLMKILNDDPKATYPNLFKSVGTAPKQYKVVAPPPDVDEDELGEPDDDEPEAKEKVFSAPEELGEDDNLGEDSDEFSITDGEEEGEGDAEEGAEEGADSYGMNDDSTEDY
jgi:hypothetical protein